MKDFLITLCLGWTGIHRFKKKKYLTGAIWLCTLGLCGVGWTIDTVIAFMKMLNGNQTKTENTNKNSVSTSSFKIFTDAQIKEMPKADILHLAADLGYFMSTSVNNTKDEIIADFMKQQEEHPSTDTQKRLIKTFDTELTGTFAKCVFDKEFERAGVLCSLKPKDTFYLEYWEYQGNPAYYVMCKRDGLDMGCIPASIAKVLHDVYRDCEPEITLPDKAKYNNYNELIQKIKIEIYK